MNEHLSFPITSTGPVSREAMKAGFTDFLKLAEHVQAIPYGRPADTHDVLSTIRKNRGNIFMVYISPDSAASS